MRIVIENTIVINIIAKAMVKGISPLAVSNAMEVVNIRVTYLMFPPIIMAIPSSAKALLNEAIIARVIPPNASFIMA